MKKIIAIGLCLVGIMLPIGLQALEEEDNTIETVIRFDLTAEDRFTYEVRVSEGGYLKDGEQRITNGIVEYELSVGQTKEFEIEADKGYEVKEIRINEEEIHREVDRIEIAGVSGTSVLEVRYGRIEEEVSPPVPDIPPPDKGEEPEIPVPPEPEVPDKEGLIEETDNGTEEGKENEVESIIPITADMVRISEYVCLMLIVVYRIYVSRRGIDMYEHVDNKENKNLEGGKER